MLYIRIYWVLMGRDEAAHRMVTESFNATSLFNASTSDWVWGRIRSKPWNTPAGCVALPTMNTWSNLNQNLQLEGSVQERFICKVFLFFSYDRLV